MRSLICVIVVILNLVTIGGATAQENKGAAIEWVKWSEDIFDKASAQKRLVVLDLEAIWCHWCHVMEEETYSNPQIISLIRSKYIAVRVDQDSRPDLANRYRDYGWPATIFFDSKGEELAKRAGFIEPSEMLGMLKRFSENPKPEDETTMAAISGQSDQAVLSPELKTELINRHNASFDSRLGGLQLPQKYLEAESIEYSLTRPREGNQRDLEIAKLTLDNNLKIFDPVWGGVYQYSTHSDWDHPHFEKIMSAQANNMRIYALAYAILKDKHYLDAAEQVRGYIKQFLTSPEGAFYTSQDADLVQGQHSAEYFALDDAGRRKQGIPAVDKNIYARENGWMIASLAALYAYSGDSAALKEAISAAEWISKNRALPEGGFLHSGNKDVAGPYLGDSLEMGRAFLALYSVTAEQYWLKKAEQAAHFIGTNFVQKEDGSQAGFFTSSTSAHTALKPVRLLIENVNMARFANLLFHFTGKSEYRNLAEQAMRYLSLSNVALGSLTEAGVLIVDQELSRDPLHVTVVGSKNDALSKDLFLAALSYPSAYKRVEWWDKSEGQMPNPDVQYPQLDKPAAFICTNKRCSLPLFKAESIANTIELFEKSGTKL